MSARFLFNREKGYSLEATNNLVRVIAYIMEHPSNTIETVRFFLFGEVSLTGCYICFCNSLRTCERESFFFIELLKKHLQIRNCDAHDDDNEEKEAEECSYTIRYAVNPVHVLFDFQFGRWSLLTAGILYGAYHHNRLSKKEAIYRKLEAEKQVIRDAQEAIAKKKRAEGNNINIVYLFIRSSSSSFQAQFTIIPTKFSYRGNQSSG